MKISELAHRYAKAIFELAVDNRTQDRVMDELRVLQEAFNKDVETRNFLTNPMVPRAERLAVVEKAFDGKGFSQETADLVKLLVRKDRFGIFDEVVMAYEAAADAANNVCRGTVRSAVPLSAEERQKIESTVENAIKKKVIMTYKVDPSVIGGLVAQVGSFTFDDSISTHLRRLNEELKRRTV